MGWLYFITINIKPRNHTPQGLEYFDKLKKTIKGKLVLKVFMAAIHRDADDFLKNATPQQEEIKEKRKTHTGFVYCLLVQIEEPWNNFAVKFQTNIWLKKKLKKKW